MLEGVRVVDLTSVVFGPYCTQILADLGAEVTKIEPPTGDQYRYSGKSAKTPGMSPGHMNVNRGKRSVVLDLKQPSDLERMRGLIADADVFIHNVRLKGIERLGLDFAAVRALKPDIIYVHCVGFGSDGPYRDLQAYDDVIQAASGTATLVSRVDGDPRPRYIPSLIADKVAGLHAAYAVMAAAVHRLRTGQGQFAEVPMFETFTHFMLMEHLAGQTFDPPVGSVGYGRQLDPHRQPFPTADGHICIVPYTDESWARIFAILGAPEVLEQERFATQGLRGRNVTALYQEIAALTPRRTTEAWLASLHAASIAAMPVRDIAAIRDDPHLQAVGFFMPQEHPTEGRYVQMKAPVTFSAAHSRRLEHAPALGEHNDFVARKPRA
ncbi:MAG TPA: CoA transferase [Steroidobacteraceae bacterium]|jgi:crotonobetainyl-CoA:carnitine CoA-transferase CaiB-like acyl-CoA transferase